MIVLACGVVAARLAVAVGGRGRTRGAALRVDPVNRRPIFPGKRYEDWVLDDPAGQDLETVCTIRDELDARVQNLVAELLPDA